MIEVTWLDAIDPPWHRVEPVCIGDVPSGLGTSAKYILVAQDDEPLLRVDAYPSSVEGISAASKGFGSVTQLSGMAGSWWRRE